MQTRLELNSVFYDAQDIELARQAFASQAKITVEPGDAYIGVVFDAEHLSVTIALEFTNAVMHYRQNR